LLRFLQQQIEIKNNQNKISGTKRAFVNKCRESSCNTKNKFIIQQCCHPGIISKVALMMIEDLPYRITKRLGRYFLKQTCFFVFLAGRYMKIIVQKYTSPPTFLFRNTILPSHFYMLLCLLSLIFVPVLYDRKMATRHLK
jgi:hypothetical protein